MNSHLFFGLNIDPFSLGGRALVLMLATLLGGLIGLERQINGNPAGMRTHILVCVGSTVITLTSVEISAGVLPGTHGDPAHLAAQIVSGIGFLGAGAILREGNTVRGVTTAAGVWATAGIGIALGASPHLGELGLLAAGVVLITLTLLRRVERRFNLSRRTYSLEIEVRETHHAPARVLEMLAAEGLTVVGMQSEPGPASLRKGAGEATRLMRLQVSLPKGFDRNHLNVRLAEQEDVISFFLE